MGIADLQREQERRREDVADALLLDHGGERRPGKEGRQRIRHHCLFHPDPGRSADYYADDGFYICFGGCDPGDRKGRTYALDEVMAGLASVEPAQPVRNGHGPKPRPRVVKSYVYEDEDGAPLRRVDRTDPKDGFPQWRMTPDGWKPGVQGVKHVPYRLPELLAAGPDEWVAFCRGEKDADVMVEHGFASTTNDGGENKRAIIKAIAPYFRGKSIVLFPDQDKAGRTDRDMVVEELRDVVADLVVIDVPRGKDPAEFFELGGTDDELQELFEAAPSRRRPPAPSTDRDGGFHLEAVDDVLAEPDEDEEYVIEDLLPVGGFAVIGAKPKVGKSVLVREACAAVAMGEEFLGRRVIRGPVIYFGLEEHRRTVRKHFQLLIGPRKGVPLHMHLAPAPLDAVKRLPALIEQYRPVLVVVDPLFKFVRAKDEKAYADITDKMGEVLAVARDSGCHILLTHHNGKIRREDGGDNLLGSTAIFANVDVALIYQRKTDNTRVLSTIQRDGKDMPETIVRLDETGGLYLGGSAQEAEQEKLAAAILAELRAAGVEGLTKNQLVEKVGQRRDAVLKAADKLYDAGTVYRHGEGKRNDPVTYWLQPPAADSVPEFSRATETASVSPAKGSRPNTDTSPNSVPARNRRERNPSSQREAPGTEWERNPAPVPATADGSDTTDAARQTEPSYCPDCGLPLAPMAGGRLWCIGCAANKVVAMSS